MPRNVAGAVAGLIFALPLAAAAGDTTIEVGHNRLDPGRVMISTGETVTFHNQDEMPGGHTVAAVDGAFQSPPLAKGDTWSHTFEEPGTYTVRIEEHPEATAEIVVHSQMEHEKMHHESTERSDERDGGGEPTSI